MDELKLRPVMDMRAGNSLSAQEFVELAEIIRKDVVIVDRVVINRTKLERIDQKTLRCESSETLLKIPPWLPVSPRWVSTRAVFADHVVEREERLLMRQRGAA